LDYILENQGNKCQCFTKIDRKHYKIDIEYLEDMIDHIKLIKIKGKDEYLKSLNENLQLLKNEIDGNIELEEK
jgi:hypothetical protein